MTYDEFNDFCSALPCATYIIQWGDSHVWKVGGKVFAIGGWEVLDRPAFSFKTSDVNFHFLEQCSGYKPAPYLASRGMKWIQQYGILVSEDVDLKHYLRESHQIVSLGLTKKKQKELGLNLN